MLTALAAFFLFSLYDAAIKLGQAAPVSPFLILATTTSTCAAFLIAHAWYTKTLPTLVPSRPLRQSLVAVSNIVMSFSIVIALRHLPLTLFYIFIFSSPLLIALISAKLMREHLSFVKVLCLLLGFAGTILAIGTANESDDVIGYIAIAFGVIGFCGRALFVRALGKTVTTGSTLILCNIFGIVCGSCAFLLFPGDVYNFEQFLLFAFAGLMTATGSTLYFRALQNTSSTNVAQLHYAQIVFGAILAFFLWNEIPTWNRVAGSAVIVASGILLAAQERKSNPRGHNQ